MNALAKMPAIEHPQIELRVFDKVPARHTVFAVDDHSCMPLVHRGEVLVVKDAPRTYPVEGQWYLIQWITPPHNEWERARVGQTIGIPREIKPDFWGYGPPCRSGPGVTYCGDFGFTWEQMTDYIRGPVVGVYRPEG